MAHTPGPWSAIKAAHGVIDIFDGRGRDIVTVFGGGVEPESKEANARLMAASPELLDAVKKLRRAFWADSDIITADEACDLIDEVDRVIAKAEGR